VQVVAVDWSGVRDGAANKIWTAVVRDGRLAALENGRDREQVCRFLLDLAAGEPETAIGLDFAFSLPAWFLRERRLAWAPDLWELARDEGEGWLSACSPPFWGRGATKRPPLPAHFRWTDRQIKVGGISPKSVFQIGGAGAVGTSSVRGWPCLQALREGGIAIWPFDRGALPVAVEVYPRLLTGPVVKSSAGARAAYLKQRLPGLQPEELAKAAGSEDAFDAAVAAMAMYAFRDHLRRLPPVTDKTLLMEGVIWDPAFVDRSGDGHLQEP